MYLWIGKFSVHLYSLPHFISQTLNEILLAENFNECSVTQKILSQNCSLLGFYNLTWAYL